jgi:hypothetical protein
MDEHKIAKEKAFVVRDGTTLHSLKDLYGHLAVIKDEDFRHHVNEQKNDFAAWIEHVHGDRFLAASARRANTKEELQRTIFISMFR